MTRARELVNSTLIVGVGKLTTSLLSFLALFVYTRFLSLEEYGYADLAIAYMSVLLPLITLRIESALFRWLVGFRGDEVRVNRVIATAFSVLVVGLAIFTITTLIVSSLYSIPYMEGLYFYIVSSAIFAIFSGIPRGLGQNKNFAIGNIVMGMISVIVGIVLVVGCNLGVEGILIGYVCGNIAGCMYIWHTSKLKLLKIGMLAHQLHFFREMIKFSLPMIPDKISSVGILAAAKLTVSVLMGVASSGIYAVVSKFGIMYTSVLYVFDMTWQESASINVKSDKRDEFYSSVVNAAVAFFGFASVLFVCAVPIIFPILINESFKEAYLYIPILLIGLFFDSLAVALGSMYIAIKHTKVIMHSSILSVVISVSGTLLLINWIGLFAPVLSIAVAYLTSTVLRYVYIMQAGVVLKIDWSVFAVLFLSYAMALYVYYNFSDSTISWFILTAAIAVSAYYNRKLIATFISVLLKR